MLSVVCGQRLSVEYLLVEFFKKLCGLFALPHWALAFLTCWGGVFSLSGRTITYHHLDSTLAGRGGGQWFSAWVGYT